MRVLIWGSSTPLSTSWVGVAIQSPTHPISSVWRFGKDSKHLANGGEVSQAHETDIVTDLQGTQISLNQGIKGICRGTSRWLPEIYSCAKRSRWCASSRWPPLDSDRATRDVPIPTGEIATSSPCMSYSTVAETPPTDCECHRSSYYAEYRTTYRDR